MHNNKHFRFSLFIFLFLVFIHAWSQNLQLGLPLGHIGDVVAAHFSPDAKYILTASKDKTAKLFEVQTGVLVQSFEDHFNELVNAQFFKNGTQVLTSSKDGTAKLFDIETGEVLKIFDQYQPILETAVSPNEELLVSCSELGSPFLYNLKSNSKFKILGKNIDEFTEVVPYGKKSGSLYLSNNYLLLLSYEGHFVLDVNSKRRIIDLENEPGDFGDIVDAVFTQLQDKLVLLGANGSLSVFSLPDGALLFQKDSLVQNPFLMTALNDGNEFRILGDNGQAIVNINTQVVSHIPTNNTVIKSCQFASVSGQKALLGCNSQVSIVNLKTGNFLNTYSYASEIVSLELSPDGKHFVVVFKDDFVCLYDAESGKLLRKLQGKNKEVYSFDYLGDKDRLFLGFKKGGSKYFELSTGIAERKNRDNPSDYSDFYDIIKSYQTALLENTAVKEFKIGFTYG